MQIDFNSRAQVPGEVLVSDLDGESVLLNLKTESYFGLDEVGAWMWNVVTGAESIEAAYEAMKDDCDVDPARLRTDLSTLLEQLVAEGLIRIES